MLAQRCGDTRLSPRSSTRNLMRPRCQWCAESLHKALSPRPSRTCTVDDPTPASSANSRLTHCRRHGQVLMAEDEDTVVRGARVPATHHAPTEHTSRSKPCATVVIVERKSGLARGSIGLSLSGERARYVRNQVERDVRCPRAGRAYHSRTVSTAARDPLDCPRAMRATHRPLRSNGYGSLAGSQQPGEVNRATALCLKPSPLEEFSTFPACGRLAVQRDRQLFSTGSASMLREVRDQCCPRPRARLNDADDADVPLGGPPRQKSRVPTFARRDLPEPPAGTVSHACQADAGAHGRPGGKRTWSPPAHAALRCLIATAHH